MQRNAELVSCCVANCPSPPEPFGQRCGTSERPILDGGTDGSNPVPSSSESVANLTSSPCRLPVDPASRSEKAFTRRVSTRGHRRRIGKVVRHPYILTSSLARWYSTRPSPCTRPNGCFCRPASARELCLDQRPQKAAEALSRSECRRH